MAFNATGRVTLLGRFENFQVSTSNLPSDDRELIAEELTEKFINHIRQFIKVEGITSGEFQQRGTSRSRRGSKRQEASVRAGDSSTK